MQGLNREGQGYNKKLMRSLLIEDNRSSAERNDVRLIQSSTSYQVSKPPQAKKQQRPKIQMLSAIENSQLATNVEEILFTMFEEQPDSSQVYNEESFEES